MGKTRVAYLWGTPLKHCDAHNLRTCACRVRRTKRRSTWWHSNGDTLAQNCGLALLVELGIAQCAARMSDHSPRRPNSGVNGQFEVPGLGQVKVPGLRRGSGSARGGSVPVLGLSHAVW